jgi:hypothetical protein
MFPAHRASIGRWLVSASAGVVLYAILWFVLFWPLMPRTQSGWIAWCLAALAFALVLRIGSKGLGWFENRPRHRLLWKSVGFLTVAVFAAAVFATVYLGQEFIAANFSYIRLL